MWQNSLVALPARFWQLRATSADAKASGNLRSPGSCDDSSCRPRATSAYLAAPGALAANQATIPIPGSPRSPPRLATGLILNPIAFVLGGNGLVGSGAEAARCIERAPHSIIEGSSVAARSAKGNPKVKGDRLTSDPPIGIA